MSAREKLIEEAAKADFYVWPDDRSWEDVSDKERTLRLRGMAAALAVFEKAHTPTEPPTSRVEPSGAQVLTILVEAHRVWLGIERGTHTARDLDEVLDPQRWTSFLSEREPPEELVHAGAYKLRNMESFAEDVEKEDLLGWSENVSRSVLRAAWHALRPAGGAR